MISGVQLYFVVNSPLTRGDAMAKTLVSLKIVFYNQYQTKKKPINYDRLFLIKIILKVIS